MSIYTSTRRTTDHGSRFGVKPTRVVLHHAATTSLAGLLRLMMPGGRTVSAHAAISGDQIVSVVPESRRSYSLASALFERGVLSAECVNSTGAPNWALSDRTHESIAQWVADCSRRHGIRPHRDGKPKTWTVIGHREVYTIHRRGYATACPGGMKLDSITRRAQQILASSQLAGGATTITDTRQGLPNMKHYSIFLHREGKNQAWHLVGDGVRSLISESAKRELLPIVEGGSGVVGGAGSEALNTHLLAVQAQRGGGSYVGPDAEQIATEVIRQQKLPGN